MKFREVSFVDNSQLSGLFMEIAKKLASGSLTVENEKVVIPTGETLEFKVKYEHHEFGGELGLKASWGTDEPDLPEEIENA